MKRTPMQTPDGWWPSLNLRWLEREDGTKELQQLWGNDDGRAEWRPVKTVSGAGSSTACRDQPPE